MLLPIGIEGYRRRTPYGTYLLVLANLAVFLLFNSLPDKRFVQIVQDHGLVPAQWSVIDGFTSMFLHADGFHLLGNMYLLWLVGRVVEERQRAFPFLLFYLISGLAAAAVHVYKSSADQAAIPTIGASGAVYGVVGAFLVFFPRRRVVMLLWLFILIHAFRARAWVLVLLCIGNELLQAYNQSQGEQSFIAVWAHLGGFAFGAVIAFFWRLVTPTPPSYSSEG